MLSNVVDHFFFFFFFNDTATTEIYTLSLHDALPISRALRGGAGCQQDRRQHTGQSKRSEEHTSELQSQSNIVCRLLLEKKKKRGDEKPNHWNQSNRAAKTSAPSD